jgi:phage I-like protein
MTKSVAEKLSDLVEAMGALPDQAQEALVDEFTHQLADFTDAELSDGQRAEVDRRLANPRYADRAKVREFFARFGVQAG